MPYRERFAVDAAGNYEDGITYEGFSPYRGATKRMAFATFDGEVDMYDVDDGADLAAVTTEINRMYQNGYDRLPERLRFLTDCA